MVLNDHIIAGKISKENIQNVQSTYINIDMNSTKPSTQIEKYIFLHGKYLQDQKYHIWSYHHGTHTGHF